MSVSGVSPANSRFSVLLVRAELVQDAGIDLVNRLVGILAEARLTRAPRPTCKTDNKSVKFSCF
jgi:hypothetical protein